MSNFNNSIRFALGVMSLLLSTAVAAEHAQLRVVVTPSNSALKKNIEGYIGSLGDRDAEALLRYRRVADTLATNAAQALGYYHAEISSEVNDDKDEPRLTLHVKPGEPLHLRNVVVRIEGPATELKAFKIPPDEELKPGAVLNHGYYDEVKNTILNLASRYGFFSGKFTKHELFVDPKAGFADVELVYQSGPRYELGAVTFEGDFPFDDDLLRRMLPFKSPTPYDSALIVELDQALTSSGYFESVQVDANPNIAEHQVIPVEVQLQARKPRSMGLGLGFSTDVGARVRADWTRHWVNSKGDSYGAELEVSAPQQNIGLWYDIPLERPLTDKLRLAGVYQAEDLPTTDTRSKVIKIGPEWHTKLDNGWLRVISLKWQRDDYDLAGDSGLSTLLMPGISYSILHSDNTIDPNNGYRVQFELSGAAEGVFSDANMVHAFAQIKGLKTLFERHRFFARLAVGGNEGSGLSNVPPSLRFFVGGDQSVRGYDYQSLSPTNRTGDKIGGRYMVASSVEYQYGLTDTWRLATFYDVGNSFDRIELPSLKRAVGVGVRWVSPLGPLRLDLAHPLDHDGGVRLHFSMGPEL